MLDEIKQRRLGPVDVIGHRHERAAAPRNDFKHAATRPGDLPGGADGFRQADAFRHQLGDPHGSPRPAGPSPGLAMGHRSRRPVPGEQARRPATSQHYGISAG
jgi:hypothetical protein